jgi:hypothetical protein
MTEHLHVFALNIDPDLRHTHLTRALGEKPDLPPLADWIGVGTLNPRDIELFPVTDLGDMPLSDYITAAFTPETDIAGDLRARLNALDGSVLLVPDKALGGAPSPGAQATAIAAIPLARPDHAASLPPADVKAPLPRPAPPDKPRKAGRGRAMWVLIALVVLAALLWVIL